MRSEVWHEERFRYEKEWAWCKPGFLSFYDDAMKQCVCFCVHRVGMGIWYAFTGLRKKGGTGGRTDLSAEQDSDILEYDGR